MTRPAPPRAPKKPRRLERHGIVWEDPYAWLRDPAYPEVKDPEIRGYLEAENAWFEAVMGPYRGFIDELHAELKGRIKDDDSAVPAPEGDYAYFWRFQPGAQYRTWYRTPRDGGEETVILDEVELAQGTSYFNLRALVVSPDARLLAYSTDEDGSERYSLHIKDLESGTLKGDLVGNTSGAVAWSADGATLFYIELNDNLRPFRVRAHRLGSDAASDRIVFEENDPAFFVHLAKTLSRRYIVIYAGTHVTREAWLMDAEEPEAPLRPVAPRREGHRYSLSHAHGRFFILTNDRHENFRLCSAPEATPEETHWQEEIAPSDRHYLLDVACFADFMVVTDRIDGQVTLRVRGYDGSEHAVDFGEAVYAAGLGDNREFTTDRVRLGFSSLTTPGTVFDYVVAERRLITRKVQEIPSGYDASAYESRRLWATAPDGAAVPISLVHRKDFRRDGRGPLFLYGYGAYGMGMEPAFSPQRLSLLDRGFGVAIAHIRGGDELGHRWYREGKLEHKTNSFTDFIACAERLIDAGYTRPRSIAIRGGSAGGMLMGAVATMRPDLWRCVVAEVPFVDVLNTMLDDSLPLTPIEWPEWGNPIASREDFERIRSWSPYDQVEAKAYPPMLVTAGISDPRVTYWEPAKFVARLRELKTDDNLLLLKTNMDAGHFGASGRYDLLKELAEILTFILLCFDRAPDSA